MNPNNADITSSQHQRMRDALQLAQTRFQNIEETIKRLRSLQEKLYRHQQLNSELDINSKELFILNKEYATFSEEAAEMDRFETFESIMAPFLRMQLLENEAEENRRTGNELEQQIRSTNNNIEDLRKHFSQTHEKLDIEKKQHQDLCHIAEECCQHDGACSVLQISLKNIELGLNQAEDRLLTINEQLGSTEQYIEEQEKVLEALGSKRHNLESHGAMLDRVELSLNMLQHLETLRDNLNKINAQYNKYNTESIRASEELGKIIQQYSNLEQQIQSLRDEQEIHRSNILGMRSYDVQEKVMTLKSNLLMLGAAQSLWRRISTGYARIEEKTQLINSLRLEIEHDLKAEQNLTNVVATLKRQVADKEYSLNMSKSQSLISLRADLREGTACSVCGATHHPYHSDTMQDQYKLISDFRSDYETMSGELQGLERQLSVLHDKLTQNLGQQIAEHKNLDTIILRQEEDVKEWRIFTSLDPTFADCSESIDGDARMATIRQLQDNTQRDLQTAEATLGSFNYHTTQITNLSAKITELESKQHDIASRKNETDALCRILSAQTNVLDEERKLAQEKYHQHYELLQKEITLTEWYKMWQTNAETLYIRLQEMAGEWKQANKDIDTVQKSLSEARTRLKMLTFAKNLCMQSIEFLKEELRIRTNSYNELYERRQLLLPGIATGEAFDKSLATLHNALEKYLQSTEELHSLSLKAKELEGAYNNVRNIGDMLDRKASEQQNLVDLWIRAYNASHPPVQYAELNEVLTKNIDWNEKRKRIRNNRLATSLQQQKVKAIQSEIVALEVDTGTLTQSQLTEKQLSTEHQIEQQEEKQREVAMQIARLRIDLGI